MSLATEVGRARSKHTRRLLKAQAHVAAHKGIAGRQFRKGKVTITVLTDPVLTDGILTFTVKVTRGGFDVTPKDWDVVRIHNPPILVPDSQGEHVRTSPPKVPGDPVTLRFREDPAAVFPTFIENLHREFLRVSDGS